MKKRLTLFARTFLYLAVISLSFTALYTTAQPNYSDWSAPVNLGPSSIPPWLTAHPRFPRMDRVSTSPRAEPASWRQRHLRIAVVLREWIVGHSNQHRSSRQHDCH